MHTYIHTCAHTHANTHIHTQEKQFVRHSPSIDLTVKKKWVHI
jgi:hypothetical protein